jgi:phospholipase/carboxylesterase
MLHKIPFSAKILTALLMICLFLCSPAFTDEEKKPTDWDRITSIDPLREDIGDFLKHDLNLFQFRAQEAFNAGDFINAAKYYLFILHHRTDSPITLYNLACCYAKLNRPDLAAKYVLQSVLSGFYNIEHFLKDKDFDAVRGKSEFDKVESDIKDFGESIGEKVFLVTSKIQEGRLHLPEKYDPLKSYPLVIGLHGYGGNAENFASMWKNFKNKDFFFLVPEAPYELNDPGINGPSYGWFYLTPDRKIWEFIDPITADNIIKAAEQIVNKYKIDRTYIFGFSQGVSAAFMTAYQKPELFEGVIAFAGRLPEDEFLPKKNIEAFKKLKFYIAHGTNDKAVGYQESLNTKRRLEGFGCKPSYYEFEGGHFVDSDTINYILESILEDNN